MIKSRLNPEIQYEEKRELNAKDKQQALDLYEDYEVLPDTPPLMVAVGVQQTHAKDNSFWYRYLYATRDPHFQSALGVIEIPKDQYLNVLDEDGDLVLEKTKPLLFSFIQKENLLKIHEKQHQHQRPNIVQAPKPVVVDLSEEEEESEENKKIKALIEPTKKAKSKDKEKGEKGKDKEKKNTLLEGKLTITKGSQHVETKEEAKKLIEDFTGKSGSHEWLQERMKNTHYSMVDVPGDGDCFFHVVCEAFASVGLQTTVSKCREFLSNHTSVKKTFQEEQQIFSGFQSERAVLTENNTAIARRVEEIKTLLKKSPPLSEPDQTTLAEEKRTLLEKQRRNNEKIADVQSDIDEIVPHMNRLTTLEKYREYIRTSQFWANEWAIETLEKELQVKFILFPENDDVIYTVGTLDKPNRYILAAFVGGNHYNLIQYNQTRLFLSFDALPYSVKCLGVKYLTKIPDFTRFRCEVVGGGESEESDEDNSVEEDDNGREKFVFSADAKPHVFPKEQKVSFFELRRKKNAGWEKVLSDDFLVNQPLLLDGMIWNSVTHYVLAGQFHPHSAYYKNFSADSHTLISQNVEVAEKAVQFPGDYTWNGKKSGDREGRKITDKNLLFVPIPHVQRDTLTEERAQKRRRAALETKLKNPLIKHLLLSTRDARLFQRKKDDTLYEDTLMMELREQNVPL